MNFLDVSTEESCKKESRRCGSDAHHVFNPWRTCVLTAVNGTYYTKMFLDNLQLAILRKRPQLLLQGVILLQENATSHPQRDVQAFSAGMGLKNPRTYFILSRPCTLRLLLLLSRVKKRMRRCRFESADTIDATVKKRTWRVRRTCYRAPLYHLPYRWGSEKTLQVVMSSRGNVGIYYYVSFILYWMNLENILFPLK